MNAHFRYEEILRPYRIFQEGGKKYYKKKGKKVRVKKGTPHHFKKIKRITSTFKNRDLVKSLQGNFEKSFNRTNAGRDLVNTTQYIGAIYKTTQDLNEQVGRQKKDLDSLEALLEKTRKSGKIVDLTTLLTKPEALDFYNQLIAQGFGPARAEEEFIKKFPEKLAEMEDRIEQKRRRIKTLELEGIEKAEELKKQRALNNLQFTKNKLEITEAKKNLSVAQKDYFRTAVTGTEKRNQSKLFFNALKDIDHPYVQDVNRDNEFYQKMGNTIRDFNVHTNNPIPIKKSGKAKINSAYTYLQRTNPESMRDLKRHIIPNYVSEPRNLDQLRDEYHDLRDLVHEEYPEVGEGKKIMKEGPDTGGGLWNYEIDKIMQPYKKIANFQGTIPREDVGPMMDRMGTKFSFIYNTSSSTDPPSAQKHWIAMCASDDGSLEMYDPLGLEPIHKDVLVAMMRYMKRQNIMMKPKLNTKSDQSAFSDSCGWICIRFLLERFCLKWPFAVASRFKTIKQSEEGIKLMEKDFGYV